MDSLPFAAQNGEIGAQSCLYAVEFSRSESVILPQFGWSARTAQIEHGLAALANHMDMRRPVIIGIDHDAQSANAKNRRHLLA
jgi:hypothetical protein